VSPFRALFFRNPEESYFKYHKIFFYATLALCLPILANAWLAKSPLSLLFLPAVLVFAGLLTVKKYFFIAMELKAYADMAAFIILYVSGEVDQLTVAGSIYTSFLIYFLLNLFILRSRLLLIISLAYVCVPLFISSLFHSGNFYIIPSLSLLAALIALVIYQTKVKDDLSRALRQKEWEARHREISDFDKITKLNEDFLIHDCRNILQNTLQIELEHQKGACSERALETALSIRSQILEKLDLISGLSKTEVAVERSVREILEEMLGDPNYFRVAIPEDLRITFNPKLFESLIFNLLKNAIEAWKEKHGDLTGFLFQAVFAGETLCLEDNAGGFEPSQIRKGHTTKPSGNGEFLYLLVQNQKELGLRVEAERTPDGMRFHIGFSSQKQEMISQ